MVVVLLLLLQVLAKGADKRVALMLDTKGPEIRTSAVRGGKDIQLEMGQVVSRRAAFGKRSRAGFCAQRIVLAGWLACVCSLQAGPGRLNTREAHWRLLSSWNLTATQWMRQLPFPNSDSPACTSMRIRTSGYQLLPDEGVYVLALSAPGR